MGVQSTSAHTPSDFIYSSQVFNGHGTPSCKFCKSAPLSEDRSPIFNKGGTHVLSVHHALFPARVSELVEIQEHFAHFLPEVGDRHHAFEGFEGDLVVAGKGDTVDVAPGFEQGDPGERAAGAEEGRAGRGLPRRAAAGAGAAAGGEGGAGGGAGTDLGEAVGAVGLLLLVRDVENCG